jgi:hypothetical protein
MVSFQERLWFTIYQAAEVVDSAGDAWKRMRHEGERRCMKKRRRFQAERRSGWDRRARAATVSSWTSWPVAW